MAGFCREDILMEDNDILVVHKHAGMAVQNARMGQMDLEHALLNYLAKQTRAETPGQRGLRFHIWRSFTGSISRLRACWCLRKTKTPQENWDGR